MDKIKEITFPKNAGALLITSDINRRYFTGMKSSAGFLLIFPDKAYLLVDFRYIEKARESVTNCEVVELVNAQEQIDDLMRRNICKTLAVESMDITVSRLELMKQKFPDIEFIATDELSRSIYDLRTAKTEDELEKMRQAQEIAENAFDRVLPLIKPGITEREIAIRLNDLMMRNGAEGLSFDTIVLSGKNTSMPHGVPTDKRVERGDFVLMDFGAVYEGYHSDMTRTVCVGQPTDEMKNVYKVVLDAQNKAIAAAKAYMTGIELDAVARDYITEQGYGDAFGHSLGHGVGMEIHEFPNASTRSHNILPENAVITIEPGIYLPGKFGVRIEDFVAITRNRCRNLTKCPKNLIIL